MVIREPNPKLLSVTAVLVIMLGTVSSSNTAAQQQSGRLAVDDCGTTPTDDPNDEDGYISWCAVHVHDLASGYSWYAGPGHLPALSPDGSRVAFFELPSGDYPSEPAGLTIVTLRDGSRVTLPQTGSSAAWSHDGRIAFVSARTGTLELYVVNADGSGLTLVTSGSGVYGGPSWSPDGRIAFVCKTELERTDICSIRSDGTQLARLTNLGNVTRAVFSPDGSSIAFVRDGGVSQPLRILNADGTITDLNCCGIYDPSWSPDGSRIAFTGGPAGIGCDAGGSCGSPFISYLNVDGSGTAPLVWGSHPSWGASPSDGLPPTAYFLVECTQLVCVFDAAWSRDDGAIASYHWKFGDGSVASGVTPAHTYAAAGSYEVELTVVDDAGVRASMTRAVDVTDHVNSPPVASFTVDCRGLACTLDASGSSDPDDGIASYFWTFGDGGWSYDRINSHTYAPGTYVLSLTVWDRSGARDSTSLEILVTNAAPQPNFAYQCDAFGVCTLQATGSSDPDGSIVSYHWNLGDGHEAAGSFVTHSYAAAGTYVVALTVTDNYGATSSRSAAVNVQRAIFHIGDLDGGAMRLDSRYWRASVNVVVHDADHQQVIAAVSGVWSTGGTGSCSPDSSGGCTLVAVLPTSTPRVTFTVQGISVSVGTPPYDALLNHDVDGGTNGTSITILRK